MQHILFLISLLWCWFATAQSALPSLTWSGDLRYRLARAHEAEDEERSYQQLRVRAGFKAPVNESVQAIVRLATASSAISTNQTLGDSSDPGMPRRSFGIDLAYMDWQYFESGNLWAGRTPNPFWMPGKVQLIFDADLAFEGIAIKAAANSSQLRPFINVGGFIISENYTAPEDAVDSWLVGGDFGISHKSDSSTWTIHLGTYHYLNIVNKQITNIESGAKTDPYSYPFDRFRGNTVNVNDPLLPAADRKYFFAHQYALYDAGIEGKFKLGPSEITVFYDQVFNEKVGKYRTGREYGLTGKWKFFSIGIAQIQKESDTVVGAFSDSDANGGGTDNKGQRYQLGFDLGHGASINLTQYAAKRGVHTVERAFSATHIDASVSF